MAHYVDGYVAAVPIANLEAYRQMAEKFGKMWKEYGALEYWECVGDDVQPGHISFPQAVQLEEGEVVVLSWIVHASRESRDRTNEKVMADPQTQEMMANLPFDGSRMFWGGFKTIVEM